MDALTHAIEAYVAGLASEFSDPLALEAIEMIKDYLIKSYEGDEEARTKMHYAQCLAGMAFSNALLGITHSMAHKTGAVFGIDHGLANAIYLPYVIQYNQKACAAKYAKIAKRLNLAGNTDEELTASLVEFVRGLNKQLSIPSTLREYGVDQKEFETKVAMIAERAVADACTGANPRPVDAAEMQKIFEYVYEGKDIDF